ncbi:MAG: hypothetical protein J0I06_25440 [Planctomycetes bacterium]|nr:hypothetical protein [Planctomycetota bacterium]
MAGWDEFDRPAGERSPDELKRIVRYQRWLVAVVLAQLVLWAGYVGLLVVSGPRRPDMDFPAALTLVLGAVGGIFVFLTSWELRGAFAAVVFGLATVVPCMGLLILALVYGYATTELRKNGVKVGLFGASLAAVDERPNPYDADEDAGW